MAGIVKGKTAIVTGAGRGIGRGIAMLLANEGARIVVCDIGASLQGEGADASPAQQTVEEIKKAGGEAIASTLSITEPKNAELIVKSALDAFGRIDILVNNAGMEEVRPSLEVDEALWDRILDTNLKGAFFAAQAAARRMNGGGSILNLCSLTSEVGVPTAVPYGASKSGLLGMTRALAAEWAPRGIRVNGIGPGYFRTALTEIFYQDEAWQKAMLGKIPLKRFGRLEDLIGAAQFLCSDAAAYVTGQVLSVNGGLA